MSNSLNNIKIVSGVMKDYNADATAQAVSDKIEETIDSFLGKLSDSVANDLSPVVKVLNKAKGAAGAVKVGSSLVDSVCTVIPKSFSRAAMTNALTSVQQQLLIKFQELKKEWFKLKESIRNIGSPSLDSIVDTTTDLMKNAIVNVVDEQIRKQTGYSPVETYYMCQTALNLYKAWRDKKEAEEGQKDIEEVSETMPSTEMELSKLSSDELKEKLKSWLDEHSDALYNAYFLIVIKDAVAPLIDMLPLKMNVSVDSLLAAVQGLKDLSDLLDDLGVTSASEGSSDELNAYVVSLQTLQSSKASTDMFSLEIEDETSGKLKLVLKADPATARSAMYKVLKASNLFSSDVMNSMMKDAQTAWQSGSMTKIYTGKTNEKLTYDIEFEVSGSSDTLNVSVEETPEAEVGVVYEEVSADTGKKVLPILKTVIEALKALLPSLAAIATLLDNYKKNKEFLRDDARLNGDMFKKRTYEGLGYNKTESVAGMNVYAVRTEKCRSLLANAAGVAPQDKMVLTAEQTVKFKELLDKAYISTDDLDEEKETKVLVQVDGALDGDTEGLSTIVLKYRGELLTSDSSRDELPSQIMIGNRDHPCCPWIDASYGCVAYGSGSGSSNDSDGDETYNADSCTKIPEVTTDEMDGEQMFNTDALIGLCDIGDPTSLPDWDSLLSGLSSVDDEDENSATKETDETSDDNTIKTRRCIIEFADDCKLYDKEPYEWYVQPGDVIDNSTFIAKCVQDYIWKDVRSIFTAGVVEEINFDSGKDYHMAYQKCGANRHIVIDNYQYGTDINVDVSTLELLEQKFSTEAEITILMALNMCYSVLPQILMRRYPINYEEVLGERLYFNRPDGLQIYEDWEKHVDKVVENFMGDEDISIGDKKIRATDGDSSLLSELAQNAIDAKEKFMRGKHEWGNSKWGIIDLYQNYVKTLNKCEGDNEAFYDCRKLGISYYLKLIGKVSTLTGNEYCIEYYNLLSDITTRRNNYEHVTIDEVKKYVNKQAKPLFDKYEYSDGVVAHLDQAFPDGDTSFTDIYNWCTEHALDPDDESNKLQTVANLYKYYADNKTSYNVSGSCNTADIPELSATVDSNGNVWYQDSSSAAGKYLWLNDSNKDMYDYIGSTIDNAYEIYKLTRIEAWRLEEFWNKIIDKYLNDYDLASLLENLDEYADSLTLYAEWPLKSEIQIDGENFDYFFFDNYDYWKYESKKTEDDPEDGVASDADGVTAPTQPAEVEAPDTGSAQASLDDKGLENEEIDLIERPATQITDYKYWVKYFSLATILSLLPIYWAPGIVLPNGTIIKLPAVFIALKAVHIKCLDLLLVIGLSVRGVAILPVFLYVNLSSQDLTLLFPLVIALKAVKYLWDANIESLENIVPSTADVLINKLYRESEKLKKQNMEIDIQLEEMKTVSWPGFQQLQTRLKDAALGVGTRLKIIRGEDILKTQK